MSAPTFLHFTSKHNCLLVKAKIAEKLQKLQKNCRNFNMAKISYELDKPKQDGMRNVAVILSHKGKRRRLSTNIKVDSKDVSRAGNITSRKILKLIDDIVNQYKNRLYDLEIELLDKDVDIDWIYTHITRNTESLDFFEYTTDWISKSTLKGARNYTIMLNTLERYVGCRKLPFLSIDVRFLEGFKTFLEGHPRAQSLYLGHIRHMFNIAMQEYNTPYKRVIPASPFDGFKIPKDTPKTKDRVVNEEDLVKIYNYPCSRRMAMARDCYFLSFFLIGMNSVDLYECKDYHQGIIAYDRAKTKERRSDNAHIEICVPDIAIPLMEKYKGNSRVFDFYQRYVNAPNFNKNINKGLHYIADALNIPRFDFYSARHTWASIARNKLGIDKYTIHEALNHVSDIDVTDIYIQKDYTNINKANQMVVGYFTTLLNKEKHSAET